MVMDHRLPDIKHRYPRISKNRRYFRRQTRFIQACNIDKEKLAHIREVNGYSPSVMGYRKGRLWSFFD
jgi:hypothetical protein